MTDQDTHASIKDRIRSSFSVLSPAERQVARNILSDYPASCLGSVASIAKSSGVSAPSVVRFAKTLRFASFVEFKEAVLDEIASQSKGPLNRARTLPTETHTPRIQQKLDILFSEINHDLATIPEEDWQGFSDLLADTRKTVYIAGGRFSTAVARTLALNLQLLRPNVILLDDLGQRDKGCVLDMNRRSVFVVFDFYRYQKTAIRAANIAKRRGATVVLVSDGEISPIKVDASIVIPVSTKSFLPLIGLSSTTVMIELLLGDVYSKIKETAQEHLAEWEVLNDGKPYRTRLEYEYRSVLPTDAAFYIGII